MQNIPLHPNAHSTTPFRCIQLHRAHLPNVSIIFCIDVCILPPLQMLPSLPPSSYAQLCVCVCVCLLRFCFAPCARRHFAMFFALLCSSLAYTNEILWPWFSLCFVNGDIIALARSPHSYSRSGSTTGHIVPKCLFFTFHTI